jgi:hypothetical protein
MLMAENLVGTANDVVVVPARNAWPEYEKYHAYVCQPDRRFQQVERMAFYSFGQIYPLVPKILESFEHIEFLPEKHKGTLGALIETLLQETTRKEGTAYKVIFLSPPESPDTLKLDGPTQNDLTSASGRTTAFTQYQRYVASERLKLAKVTSDLISE